MKCPECKKPITKVRVYSQTFQFADVDEVGQIDNYGRMEEVLETQAIEHADGDCCAELQDILTE